MCGIFAYCTYLTEKVLAVRSSHCNYLSLDADRNGRKYVTRFAMVSLVSSIVDTTVLVSHIVYI
jgi:hypothetical protein